MASSLLVLLDDIASVLDDVAVLTQLATKKTAGVLGDDLALNAQQVTGIRAERELPVVFAVAKGSLINKAILVPVALVISALAPWAVVPLLMIGGAFLCFEGVEKLVHKFLDADAEKRHAEELHQAVRDPAVDLLRVEQDKIKGAIRTDFVLSAEIVAITLGTVATAPFLTRVLVLSGISLLMTVGVYGLVAAIVKLDDAGILLTQSESGAARRLGQGVLAGAPWLLRALSVGGTAAMFLVGGGILTHGVPVLHHWVDEVSHGLGAVGGTVFPLLVDVGVGVACGAVLVGGVMLVKRVLGSRAA